MLVRIISALLIFCGGVLTLLASMAYRRFIKYSRHSSYLREQSGWQADEIISLVLLYIFIFGYLVGFIDVVRRDVEPIYAFVAFIFFLGGIFIYMILHTQIRLSDQARQQNLGTMQAFVNALDMKDEQNRGHSWAVWAITDLFFAYLPVEIQKTLHRPKLLDAAYLHDCGKLLLPDAVLKNKGKLGPYEWKEMREHPAYGKKILESTCFSVISDWVLYHHEKMDGSGYYGLPGDEIPLESRIINIAETYVALRSAHPYRGAVGHDKAIVVMMEQAGKQFDPELLEYFLRIDRAELQAIADAKSGNMTSTEAFAEPLSGDNPN